MAVEVLDSHGCRWYDYIVAV